MPVAGRKEQIEALVGQTIGRKYRVERLVGSGGMGAVYEALNLSINKRIALKFLFRDEGIDAATAARFQREAEAASAVASDHIVQIFDAGTSDDGRPYLVMELLDGEDLRRRLRREGRLPLAVVLKIAEQLLRTLGRAHGAGIIHRDLKPDNVFLCNRDDGALFVKIVDFGISKVVSPHDGTLTHEGAVLGTAHYMAPEQAQAFADIDGRADLFSLGAILYEALAGRPPHLGRTYEAVLILACTTPAEDIRVHAPDVPEAIAAVIAKSIAREREQRYQTALEFWQALASAAPQLGVPSSPTPTSYPAVLVDSLADTEVLGPEAGAGGSESKRRATSARRPSWPALAALGLLAGGLALAASAGRRGGAPPLASSASAHPPPSAALADRGVAPPVESSARLPAPTPTGSPSPARPVTPARPKPGTSPRASAAISAPASASSPPRTPIPPVSGVAGQLELNTQGP